jgi:hypothetical protein
MKTKPARTSTRRPVRPTREDRQTIGDNAWWNELCQAVDPSWRVFGWTGRHAAQLFTDDHSELYLTGKQRNALMTAIQRGVAPARGRK